MTGEFLLLLFSSYNPQISGFLSVIFSVAGSVTAAHKWPTLLAKPWDASSASELPSASFHQGACAAQVLTSIRCGPEPQGGGAAPLPCRKAYQHYYLLMYSAKEKYSTFFHNFHGEVCTFVL